MTRRHRRPATTYNDSLDLRLRATRAQGRNHPLVSELERQEVRPASDQRQGRLAARHLRIVTVALSKIPDPGYPVVSEGRSVGTITA